MLSPEAAVTTVETGRRDAIAYRRDSIILQRTGSFY